MIYCLCASFVNGLYYAVSYDSFNWTDLMTSFNSALGEKENFRRRVYHFLFIIACWLIAAIVKFIDHIFYSFIQRNVNGISYFF